MRSRAEQGFKKRCGALGTGNLQPYGATLWLYHQHKLEEAAALSFRIDRFSRGGEELAGGGKPPPKAIRQWRPFSRLRQQAGQEPGTAGRELGGRHRP
jgi:hypothetical protein